MKTWQARLEDALRENAAPAVLTRDLLARFACSARQRQPLPDSSLSMWIKRATVNGKLKIIQRGLYLNLFRTRPPQLADAVPMLYKDAVVSLATVLGDAGVLNNPSNTVTAVVPFDRHSPLPHLGRKSTRSGTFHFFGIPRRILEAGKPEDRLEPAEHHEHPRATPEKALIDWLYLGQSSRSRRTLPPKGDIDLALLDLRRLRRLALAADIKETLQAWIK